MSGVPGRKANTRRAADGGARARGGSGRRRRRLRGSDDGAATRGLPRDGVTREHNNRDVGGARAPPAAGGSCPGLLTYGVHLLRGPARATPPTSTRAA